MEFCQDTRSLELLGTCSDFLYKIPWHFGKVPRNSTELDQFDLKIIMELDQFDLKTMFLD